MYQHILIPTDGSPASSCATKDGIALAYALGAKVTGYCALEPLLPIYIEGFGFDPATLEAIEEGTRKVGQAFVDAIGTTAKASGVPFDSLVTTPSTVYAGIIDAATTQGCDLIFMASHGHHRLSELIMGSVTQKVLAHSTIPVLVDR